jgi:Periplasmic copper-binding protein (NosD)
MFGKTNVEIAGRGFPSTTLKSRSPHFTPLTIEQSAGVVLRDFSINASRDSERRKTWAHTGIYSANSSNLHFQQIRVQNTKSAGISFWNVPPLNQPTAVGAYLFRNQVLNTNADGYHMTSAANMTVDSNYAENTGDDAYSSIGYGEQNRNIRIANNTSLGSKASGVSIEGTNDATVVTNKIYSSRHAGIRIASVASFGTGPVSTAKVIGNTLEGVRTDQTTDHAAIMVFADSGKISKISIDNNTIKNALTYDAIRVRGSGPDAAPSYKVEDWSVSRNKILKSPPGLYSSHCINIGSKTISAPTPASTGNKFNGAPCSVLP